MQAQLNEQAKVWESKLIPLLDSAGRLIGVNTAIFSPSGAYAGIGFAIPADEVNRVVPQLIQHGKITRPGLGVQVASDQIIYHPQSGWFEDTPLKGGTEAGYPLKGVEERTSLVRLRSVRGTTTALL